MIAKTLAPVLLAHGALAASLAPAEHPIVPPAIINETPSMARGLYLRVGDASAPQVGDIVATPMNGTARAYLQDRLGYPAPTFLVKRVAAVAGHLVCRQTDGVRVGARFLPVRATDSRGNRLPVWTGCRRLRSGEVLLVGDAPGSFDGRYFGLTPTRDLTGLYREAVTW